MYQILRYQRGGNRKVQIEKWDIFNVVCCCFCLTRLTDPTGFQFQHEKYCLDITLIFNYVEQRVQQFISKLSSKKNNELNYMNRDKSLLISKTIFKKIQS